jgi:hypothetical protein
MKFMMSENTLIEFSIWIPHALTPIPVFILGIHIIFLTNTKRRRRVINEKFIMTRPALSDGISKPRF